MQRKSLLNSLVCAGRLARGPSITSELWKTTMRSSCAEALRAAIKSLTEFRRSKSGNVAVLFGLSTLPLILLLGAAVDYQRATTAKSQLQSAVDTGAIAAANGSALTQTARQVLASNAALVNLGPLASQINASVTETETSGKYQVDAQANVPTAFLQIARVTSIPISATAVATNTVVGGANSSSSNVCLLALSKTYSPGLLANSNVNIDAPNCEIHVASTGNPAATFNSGDVFGVSKLCVAGSNILNNAGSIPALQAGCTVAADPFSGKLPAVTVGSCTVNDTNYSGANTLSPGVYCGNFNFNGSGALNLAPGLYIFKGTHWNINSGWTVNGAGVTFYFADASSYIQFNSGVQAYLTAPTSGTYANILMFEPVGLSSSSFTVNGGAGHSFSGLIYLPSRNITFNSMSNITAEALTIVVNSVILDTLNWRITSSPWTIPAAGAGSAKSSARLVR
jgi:Flp pilus assembly protein TadG